MEKIKKVIFNVLIAGIFCITGHISNAQRFRGGISAGFVASDVYGADIVPDADAWNDTDFRKAGFMFGGAVSTALNQKSFLRLELNYIQKGTTQPADDNGNGYYKFSFHYLEFPLIYKYVLPFRVGKKERTAFELYAGISAGKLIGTEAEGDNFYSINDYSYLNKTDVSLLVGLGYNFSDHFNFSFRYSNSVIPVFKQNDVSPLYLGSSFNNGNSLVLHFILQFMFGRSKNNNQGHDENNN